MAKDTIPTITVNPEKNIVLTIEASDAQQENQGYSYNQSAFSYNQLGVAYGGIYQQNQDVIPLFTTAQLINPTISSIIDRGSGSATPIGNSGMLMGILGLTYP